MNKSGLANRMKEYECVAESRLVHRLPVILRL